MKKSNRLMLLGGVVGLALSAAAPAFADFGPWQKADTNKDGVIDRAEFDAQGASRFKQVDANSDGFIGQDEMKAFHDAQRAKFEAARGEMAGKMIKRFDKDSDGKLSETEWPDKGRMKFADADANKDGAVTADEISAMRQKPHREAADGKDRFARLDTDKDGKLSAAEWSVQGEKMFTRFDKNKDGKIEKSELPQPRDRDHKGDDAPAQP
jgi:Ca2+-binding EF-hand superfamily protein